MKNKTLAQDNALTMARYEMTAMEKNIMYAVMAQINAADSPLTVYKISPSDISIFTKRRVRYDDFNAAVTRLLTRDFFIKNTEGFLQSTFISSAQHFEGGFATIEISPRLRPYLFELKKNFTIFGLETATALNSKYSKRLYEMLCQFRSTGVLRMSLPEMKERFCLINADGTDKFERWSSFESKVLKLAKDEINEKADFQFDYELRREGRKITGVDFKFKKTVAVVEAKKLDAQKAEPVSKESIERNRIIERLLSLGLSENQVGSVLKKHTAPTIWKIVYDYNMNKDSIKSTVGYLCKAFAI